MAGAADGTTQTGRALGLSSNLTFADVNDGDLPSQQPRGTAPFEPTVQSGEELASRPGAAPRTRDGIDETPEPPQCPADTEMTLEEQVPLLALLLC